MKAIFKKEISLFFTSPIAYLVIGSFLVINGLFLWVFTGEYNILEAGFADVNTFFFLAPWLLLFLIPAITMRSFADEYQTGTIELLKTLPISNSQIVLGKFLASLILVIIAIVPTFIYVYTINSLASPSGSIDMGPIIGSYIGLLLMASSYIAIGLFTSTLAKNQIVAFISSVLIILILLFGIDALATLTGDNIFIKKIGIYYHFKSLGRGVIDSRDIFYFFSVTLFFLYLTKEKISNE